MHSLLESAAVFFFGHSHQDISLLRCFAATVVIAVVLTFLMSLRGLLPKFLGAAWLAGCLGLEILIVSAWMAMPYVISIIFMPDTAHAAVAGGGGGMPYSTGLNTFKTSVTGEVAGIICLIGVIAGCAAYLYQGVLDPLLMKIVQVVIAICIIGGAATFITSMGVTGAVVVVRSYPPVFTPDTTMAIVAIGLFAATVAAWLQPRMVYAEAER